MRFILTLLIWIVMVGGLWLYTWQRDAGLPDAPPEAKAVEQAQGRFTLEVTPTFTIASDPFALQLGSSSAPAIELRINGKPLSVPADTIQRGQVIDVGELAGLQAGFNEIYISASPPFEESMLDHGVRVRVLKDGVAITDQTLWAGNGAVVSGTAGFDILAGKDQHHDHE